MARRLRNIFDQYTQEENHITHSLFVVLTHNPRLLHRFLAYFELKIPEKKLKLLTQTAPRRHLSRSGLPDGYIFSEDYDVCIAVESKIVEGALTIDQLKRHLAVLAEYRESYLLVLAPEENPGRDIQLFFSANPASRYISWTTLLKFMLMKGADGSAKTVGGYLFGEFIRYMERKYHMTPFNGFNFDEGYDDGLAIHYVKRVSDLIHDPMVTIYPECTGRRQSIGGPWQAWFPKGAEARSAIHPGFGVAPDMLSCTVVLPNGCRKEWKNFSYHLEPGSAILKTVLLDVYKKRPVGSRAVLSFRQRHYLAQRASPIEDADTRISISTLFGKDHSKANDAWWDHLRNIVRNKSNYNYQLEIGYEMPYKACPILANTEATAVMLAAFRALRPVYDLLTIQN